MSDEHGDADYYIDLAGTRYAYVGGGKWRRLQRFYEDRDWFLCPDQEPFLNRIMELERRVKQICVLINQWSGQPWNTPWEAVSDD